MKASIKAKSALASLLHQTGVIPWKLRQYSRSDVAVLMYHRIIPMKDMSRAVQAGMVVEPDTLDLHIKYLRKHFEIIPLSDLVTNCHSYEHGQRRKPLCVLTFDDGWQDFYDYAYPILSKHDAPAVVFLPTDFIGTNRWFWTDRVGFLLDCIAESRAHTEFVSLFSDPLTREIVSASGSYETRLERAIALLKPHRIETIEEVLSKISAALGEESIPAGRAFLSWEEVKEMYCSGLVSFGSHTAGHQVLTTLTEDQVQHELRKSMDVLISHKVASTDLISFSYPIGSFSERLVEMVREAGYHLAVTTQYGWYRQGANTLTIRRIRVHQDITATEAMFASRLANML